jgi:para-nitrobenzyl esterase
MRPSFQAILIVATLGWISVGSPRPAVRSVPHAIIDLGRLEGASFGPAENEIMFLGIPYAAPPTGDRRWKPPQPMASWAGDRKADAFRPACPQPPNATQEATDDAGEFSKTFSYYKQFQTDEDCLYINLWTTNLAGPAKSPVMVWIHGGAGVAGTGQTPPFGPALARKGVVLVTIDFRIGVLGNLAHPALTSESPHHVSGNYGALDQIAALQWIQRNISHFGGDPGNVTLFGHSNGGTQVCVLMASPLARGLFHRAILESEVCSSVLLPELKRSIRFEGSEEAGTAEDAGLRLTRDLKLSGRANVLRQLRAKTAGEIIQASHSLNIYTNPTVDGWVLSEQPAVIFRNGRQAKMPVLVGSTNDEMALNYNPETDPSTVTAYKTWLNHYLGDAGEFFRLSSASKDADVRAAFTALGTDSIGQGAYFFARSMASLGAKTYMYYFTYPGRGKTAGLGAIHGSELKFISGIFRGWWGQPSDEDKKMVEILSGYWTRFAATGNPNGPGLPPWPAFDTDAERCLEIGREIKARDVPHRDRYEVFESGLKARLSAIQPTRSPR